MPKSDHLWDEDEVAHYLNVTHHAVRKWKKLGKIPFIKLGTLTRYSPRDIRDFAERNREYSMCGGCKNLLLDLYPVQLPDEVDPSTPLFGSQRAAERDSA